jgi:uncharacterized membrane protein
MIWVLAIALSALATEVFAHLPIERSATLTLASGAQAGRIILSPAISDHWKEKVMPAYAARMGRQTMMLSLCIAALTLIVSLLIVGINRIEPDAAQFIGTPAGVLFSLIVSTLYYLARRRLVRA